MASRCDAESENQTPNWERPLANESSFTLIELLIVIGILGALATAVVLVINPAELIRQSRDSTRLSDLASINNALGLFQANATVSPFMGTSSVVYVSIPDTSGTCSSLGLPTLPGGYTYHCVSTSTLGNIDGTGWIPADLTQFSAGSPISRYPIDPVNTTTTGQYYTYTPGGSWELTMYPESQKYQNKAATDGGPDPTTYEIGSNLFISPFIHGLVGYWKFEEGNGTSATDSSVFGNTGTWNGTGTHWATGKVGSYAGQFDGSDDYVYASNYINPTQITVTLWFKGTGNLFFSGNTYCGTPGDYYLTSDGWNVKSGSGCDAVAVGLTPTPSAWNFVAATLNGTSMAAYLNGALQNSRSDLSGFSSLGTQNIPTIGANSEHSSGFFNGTIDEVRVYKRILSAAEIQAIYDATK